MSSPPKYTTLLASDAASSSSGSFYTLRTQQDSVSVLGERRPLLAAAANTDQYGTVDTRPVNTRRVLLKAGFKMAAIFIVSTLILGGTLWIALPTLEEEDRPLLRVPKSFEQLQELNGLLKKYRDIYPFRIVICYVVTYLFLQAFSLPGSMYLSILGGAVWGIPRAILLACTCVATGATLCYLISAALGPALLTLPKFKTRLEKLRVQVTQNADNIVPFLIILRIAPLPPHWVVNVACPHLGIGIPVFFVATWLGILGVTVIHTTIGGGLDDMTSPDDFHLISWRNFFGLAAVVVAVLIPVGLRHVFKKELRDVEEVAANEEVATLPISKGLAPTHDQEFVVEDPAEEEIVIVAEPSIPDQPADKGKAPMRTEEIQ